MGTRSLTHVRDSENGLDLVCIYRHLDGYCAGHGKDLKELLTGYKIVNGISMEESGCDECGVQEYWHNKPGHRESVEDHDFVPQKVANGLGDLAGQIVWGLKKGDLGGIYLYPPNSDGESYQYVVWLEGNYYDRPVIMKMMLKVIRRNPRDIDTVIYAGLLENFNPQCEREEKEEEDED